MDEGDSKNSVLVRKRLAAENQSKHSEGLHTDHFTQPPPEESPPSPEKEIQTKDSEQPPIPSETKSSPPPTISLDSTAFSEAEMAHPPMVPWSCRISPETYNAIKLYDIHRFGLADTRPIAERVREFILNLLNENAKTIEELHLKTKESRAKQLHEEGESQN